MKCIFGYFISLKDPNGKFMDIIPIFGILFWSQFEYDIVSQEDHIVLTPAVLQLILKKLYHATVYVLIYFCNF